MQDKSTSKNKNKGRKKVDSKALEEKYKGNRYKYLEVDDDFDQFDYDEEEPVKKKKAGKTKRKEKLSQTNVQQEASVTGIVENNNVELNKKLNMVICTLLAVVLCALFVHFRLRTELGRPNSISEIQRTPEEIKEAHLNEIPGLEIPKESVDLNQIKPEDAPKDQSTIAIDPSSVPSQPQPQAQPPEPEPQVQAQPKPSTPPLKRQSVNQQRYSQSLNLKDFQSDPVYKQAPPQIKQTFDEMIQRPPQKRNSPNSIFMPSQKAYFAYRLYQNPQKAQYLKAQYYYYETKYQISKFEELFLCIVAPGRNIVKGGRFKRFVDSVQRQNYSYYRMVYLDDVSDDGSAEELEKYVKESRGPLSKAMGSDNTYEGSFIIDGENFSREQDQRRLFIVKNKERIYALANRNQGIRKYCPADSIILDVDADDAIIGKQAFKFVNAIYGDPETWMFNSVFIYDKSLQKEVTTGPQDGVPMDILQSGSYRTSMIWKTSELRTFLARLFCKIDEKDFKDQKGVFYQWASDVFTQEPLVQLAGPKHYKHLYEIVYFYDWDFDKTTVFKRRHYRDIVFMQTPYKPLKSLDHEAEKIENYVVPQAIVQEYEKNIREARNEAQKYHRPPPF